jgi:toxin ParE1/3/4
MVAKRPRLEVQVTGPARRDSAAILKRSRKEFGTAAALRYEALLVQALVDIGNDPARPGSKARPEMMIEGARTYHLSSSRNRTAGPGVKEPRHFLLYRRRDDGVVEVARILHDSRDLQRHLPEDYHSRD